MKKVLILLMLILLCACNGNDREDGQNRPDETDPKPETVDTLKPLTDEYLNKMSNDEFMEVALLGVSGPELSVDDILKRAKDEWGLSFVSEIEKEDIVYGPVLGDNNLVYLFVPKDVSELKVWKIDLEENQTDGPIYEAKEKTPFIYIEKEIGMNPISIFSFTAAGEEGFMRGGLNYSTGTLRSNYYKGLVDITPYNNMTSGEKPFYAQMIFDHIYYNSGSIAKDLNDNGYTIAYADEMLYEGKMYLLYQVKDGNEDKYILAVNYERDPGVYTLLVDYNGNGWVNPDKAVG